MHHCLILQQYNPPPSEGTLSDAGSIDMKVSVLSGSSLIAGSSPEVLTSGFEQQTNRTASVMDRIVRVIISKLFRKYFRQYIVYHWKRQSYKIFFNPGIFELYQL